MNIVKVSVFQRAIMLLASLKLRHTHELLHERVYGVLENSKGTEHIRKGRDERALAAVQPAREHLHWMLVELRA